MILNLKLEYDEHGEVTNGTPSDYNPSEAIKTRTMEVIDDFGSSWNERERPFEEFNDVSLIDRINMDRQSFNQFVYSEPRDASEEWRSLAFRPIVRNKIITIAAHITATIIYPKIYAQNENDQDDRDCAEVMRDLMEWANERANYDNTFMQTVVNALVDPAAFVHTEYCKKFREIKERIEDNPDDYQEQEEEGGRVKWKTKKILDELYSGFQDSLVPCDEVYLGNFYEPVLQKQPFIIWRKVIDFPTAKAKYRGNDIFEKWVKPGVQYIYNDQGDLFYEVYDEDLRNRLVEEVIYYNREADLQLVFINGVLINDVDNPNPRKDKNYPFAATGYERFNSRFFYWKSLAFKLAPDESVINTLYRMIIDGGYLQIMPPSVIFGSEEGSSDIIAPGVVTTIDNSDNPNATWQTLNTNNNLNAGLTILEKVESSVTESSVSDLQTGEAANGSQTAYEISRLEQNARVMFGQFAKMIGFLVRDFGYLRVGDILQFMTVAEVMELESPNGRLKFKNFVIPERKVNGKTVSRKIEFDGEMPDEMTEEEKLDKSFELLSEEELQGMQIYKVNPTLFRKMKYMLRVQPEALFPKSDSLQKALMLEEYALAMNNPLTAKEAITRDLLLGAFDKTKDDPEEYMMKPDPMAGMAGGMGGAMGDPNTQAMEAKAAQGKGAGMGGDIGKLAGMQ